MECVCVDYNKQQHSPNYNQAQWFTKQIMSYLSNTQSPSSLDCVNFLQRSNCTWSSNYCTTKYCAVQRVLSKYGKCSNYNIDKNDTNVSYLDRITMKDISHICMIDSKLKRNVAISKNDSNSNDCDVVDKQMIGRHISDENKILEQRVNYKPCYRSINKRAIEIAKILFKDNSFDTVLKILDKVSELHDMPAGLNGLKIGECVIGMLEMRKTYDKLKQRTNDEITIQKHIILSSLAQIQSDIDRLQDNNVAVIDSIANKSLLTKFVGKHNSRLLKTIENIKSTFQSEISLLLHSKSSNPYSARVAPQLQENIIQYYHHNTSPSPSPNHTVYIRDKDGKKLHKHPKHYLYGSLLNFYTEWQNDEKTKKLIKTLNCPLPSLSYFRSQMPVYVKEAKQCEFNLCTYHSNFKQMWHCFYNTIKNGCKCGTHACNSNNNADIDIDIVMNGQNNGLNNENNENVSNNFQCKQCNACFIKHGELSFNYHDILQSTLCPFESTPKLNCIFGKCKNKNCGFSKIEVIVQSCHTNTINNNTVCNYYQWENLAFQSRNNKSFKYASKVPKQQDWSEFMQTFEQSYNYFIFHECARMSQHNSRKLLCEFEHGNCDSILLNDESLFCSIDYISNISVQDRNNPISSFTNQRQIAFCELFEITKQDNKLIKQSHCYISGDPKHDWQMSLLIMKKHIKIKKQVFQKMNRTLKICYFFSDRSPKEFSTTPFLAGLNEITGNSGASIVWNFTSPQHGKWLHDAEGSVIKRVYKDGILSKQIEFDSQIRFETTIVNYLQLKLSNANQNEKKIKRNFYEIHDGDVQHVNNPYNTLDGIKSYYCFRTTTTNNDNIDGNVIYCRRLSCSCAGCMKQQWSSCLNAANCGAWIKRKITKKSPKKIHASNNAINSKSNANINNNNVNINCIFGANRRQLVSTHMRIASNPTMIHKYDKHSKLGAPQSQASSYSDPFNNSLL